MSARAIIVDDDPTPIRQIALPAAPLGWRGGSGSAKMARERDPKELDEADRDRGRRMLPPPPEQHGVG